MVSEEFVVVTAASKSTRLECSPADHPSNVLGCFSLAKLDGIGPKVDRMTSQGVETLHGALTALNLHR